VKEKMAMKNARKDGNVQLSSCDAHPEAQIRKNKEEVYEWV